MILTIKDKNTVEIVKEYFSFLVTEFKLMLISEKIRGNAFYDIQYGDKTKVISINYENIEDYFQLIIFKLQNGKMPDYDDKTKTLHLNQLNASIHSKIEKAEIVSNNEYFMLFKAESKFERVLLKSAKDLRLILRYFEEL